MNFATSLFKRGNIREMVQNVPVYASATDASGRGLSLMFRRWATKKTIGSTKNGRYSKPKYLGVKKFGGEFGLRSQSSSGKGRSLEGLKFGFSLVKGKANHPMENYHVAKFMQIQEHGLGLFAIYVGHLGESVPAYLKKHLFYNILKEEEFWVDPHRSISKAYDMT
ncbi:hypothetical protein ACFE04_001640 [Oxalis oulophora]